MKDILKIVITILSFVGMILSAISMRFAVPVGIIMVILKAFSVITVAWWSIIWITIGMLALGLLALVLNGFILALTSESL